MKKIELCKAGKKRTAIRNGIISGCFGGLILLSRWIGDGSTANIIVFAGITAIVAFVTLMDTDPHYEKLSEIQSRAEAKLEATPKKAPRKVAV
jgi:hypothetical protein